MADADHELSAIRRMMDEAQRAPEDDGRYFVSWGLITIAGLGATYLTVTQHASGRTLWIVWAALIALGWALVLGFSRRDHARAPVRTIAATMVAESWAGIGIGMTVIVFAGAASGTIPALAVPGVICALMGSGTFAGASLYRQLPLRILALAWWAGAAVILLRPGVYTILLMAAMVLALFVVPGALLWTRSRGRKPGADAA